MTANDMTLSHRYEWGEMPHWDARRARLCFVDISGGTVNEFDLVAGTLDFIALTAPLGSGRELGRLPIGPGVDDNRINGIGIDRDVGRGRMYHIDSGGCWT